MQVRVAQMHRAVPILAGFAALLLVGCKRDVEGEHREEHDVTDDTAVSSAVDAIEPIVDEAYRFRLTLRGRGWKVLREQDAVHLSPNAIVAAMNSDSGTTGFVTVEHMPGTTLEQAVALWQDELADLQVESAQDIEFQGLPAKRRMFTVTRQGLPVRIVMTVFLRQDHLYQVTSYSLSSKPVEPLMAFHEAFELLDGEVSGRLIARTPVINADGIGWRIREGRYESILSGLRLRLPDGWRFVVGAELEALGTDAEIILTHDATNILVALVVERAAREELEALAEVIRQSFEEGAGALVGEPVVRRIASKQVELRRYQAAALEYVHGVYVGDVSVTALTIWYPRGVAEQATSLLDELFPGFESMQASERAKLREELLATTTGQQHFTAGRAYRAGEFLDFENQLVWTKPPGLWQVDKFDKALENSTETVLFAAEVELGVYTTLEVVASESLADEMLATLIEGHDVLSRDIVVVDDLTVHRARTVDHSTNPPMNYAFAVTRRDEQLIIMTAWSAAGSTAQQKAMQAAIAGLDYDPDLERTKISGRVYTDLRYGLAFELPTGFDGPPQLFDLGPSQVADWIVGDRILASMSMARADTDDDQWISSFVEHLLRDGLGSERTLGEFQRSEGKLGAHPARQLTWSNGVTADIVVRNGVSHCILYINLSDAQRQTVRDSWALLE